MDIQIKFAKVLLVALIILGPTVKYMYLHMDMAFMLLQIIPFNINLILNLIKFMIKIILLKVCNLIFLTYLHFKQVNVINH